ncbi:hypothetical protein ALISP_6078 [Alicycliphilus sp. B1]|nr:hypothetical protein ALISP_6078 [Alicycliphilus sp. B1]
MTGTVSATRRSSAALACEPDPDGTGSEGGFAGMGGGRRVCKLIAYCPYFGERGACPFGQWGAGIIPTCPMPPPDPCMSPPG